MSAAVENGARKDVVVALTGDLDMSTAPVVANRVRAALDAGARDVTLDAAAVTFMDTQGLYALLAARAATDARGGRFSLRSPSPAVRFVLDLTGLEPRLRSRQ